MGLIFLFILLGLIGQYLFKGGMSLETSKALVGALGQDLARLGRGEPGGLGQGLVHTLTLLLQPPIFLGLVSYALSTVCWLAVLSKTDLSFAYPMMSIGYVAILLMGWLAFGEHVTVLRWMGVLLISIGIVAIYSERRFVGWGTGFAALLTALALGTVFTSQVTDPAPVADKPVILIALAIVLGLVGQFLFKSGMNRPAYQEQVRTIGASVRAVRRGGLAPAVTAAVTTVALFLRPYVLGGLTSYGLSTVFWLALLSRAPLSFVYPLLSIGYVAILLMGWLLFHERVTVLRWYGVVLICYGIVTIYSEEMVHAHATLFASGLVGMALFLGYASRAARQRVKAV